MRLRASLLLLCFFLPAVASAQTLSYAGDLPSTRAFMADLAALYEAKGRGAIGVELVSSTEALVRASSGEVDMGGSARPAQESNRQERRASMYPIVWDALVVVANRDNPIMNISLEQLVGVYAGELTSWSDLNGAEQPIEILTHGGERHGIDHNVAELLLGDATQPLASSRTVGNMEALGEAVATAPWSLGIVTYSAARKMNVKILAVGGRSASFQTIQSGDYLLYTPLYLAVREDGRNRRDVRNFIKFASSGEAKRVLRRNGVVPYADGLALVSRQLDRAEMFERIRRN
ncbi:MAG: substrate-binding domain-containing protein [Pseudomonadota bacterium]